MKALSTHHRSLGSVGDLLFRSACLPVRLWQVAWTLGCSPVLPSNSRNNPLFFGSVVISSQLACFLPPALKDAHLPAPCAPSISCTIGVTLSRVRPGEGNHVTSGVWEALLEGRPTLCGLYCLEVGNDLSPSCCRAPLHDQVFWVDVRRPFELCSRAGCCHSPRPGTPLCLHDCRGAASALCSVS